MKGLSAAWRIIPLAYLKQDVILPPRKHSPKTVELNRRLVKTTVVKVETSETREGTRIDVEIKEKIAVIVQGEHERIYLPASEGSDSTYYVEEPEKLTETERGWTVIHRGKVNDIEVVN